MNPCVSREQLERLVSGELDGPERETVAVHVQDCADASMSWRADARSPRGEVARFGIACERGRQAALLERLSAKGPRALDADQPGKELFQAAGWTEEGGPTGN